MPERLIVVGPLPPPHHGVAVMTHQLLRALAAQGALAAHLDTADDRSLDNMGRLDVRNVVLALRHAARFVALLRRHRDAAVYVPISQNRLGLLRDATFLVAARIARRRRYVHLHGGHFAEFYETSGRPTRWLARLAVGGAHQAWVLTDGLARMFDGLVPRSRVFVLENAVPSVNGAHPRVRPVRPAPLRVLFLSTLLSDKGIFTLLDALEGMGERARGFEVHIVGPGSSEIARQIDARGRALAARGVTVERLGVVTGDAKRRQFDWSDTLALPTHYPFEGQPLVLLEAMSAGLPIVTSRHAGIPETVRHEREALLVDPGDAAGVAAALERLSRDADLCDRLGRAALDRWRERYAPDRYSGDLRRLLTS